MEAVMTDLISESITPHAGTFDAAKMAQGLPGLPSGFNWRGESVTVHALLEKWKESSHEGGREGGELYLRRHYFKLRMSDGSAWTVYFLRQAPKSGNPRLRWFLYTIEWESGA